MMTPSEASFAGFLKEGDIICSLPGIARDEVITQLAVRLLISAEGVQREAVIQAILEREKLDPTVIAPGIALPHARLQGLDAPMVGVATSSKGIDFLTGDKERVNVVILVLTPKSDPGAYLRVVAALSKALSAPRMRQRLALANSAKEIHGLLTEGGTALPAYLTAANVMDPNPITLSEGDDLARAIEILCANRVLDIPVVDEERDLRGIVSIEDILRLSLPEHLLWMQDLSPILNFEPFAELLRRDRETKVADFMREDHVSIHPDTPAIQLAKMFLMHQVRQIQIVHGRHFEGVVNVHSFIAQLFWA